jgi:hypothetical protein
LLLAVKRAIPVSDIRKASVVERQLRMPVWLREDEIQPAHTEKDRKEVFKGTIGIARASFPSQSNESYCAGAHNHTIGSSVEQRGVAARAASQVTFVSEIRAHSRLPRTGNISESFFYDTAKDKVLIS